MKTIAARERVLVAHAHPDDETLATGALLAELIARGNPTAVLTATRGEQGEMVPGSLPIGLDPAAVTSAKLTEVRELELSGALAALGVPDHCYLGQPPAAAGKPRRYVDSGMVWVRPGLAGPAPNSKPTAFATQPLADEVADFAAAIDWFHPDIVISYDAGGGYGHPDHVRMREVAQSAAQAAGVRFAEIAGFVAPTSTGSNPNQAVPQDVEILDLPHQLEPVRRALLCHRTQLSVEGDEVVHVGGQREPIRTQVGLRLIEP